MAIVYADTTYGYNSSDATINFYEALKGENNSNNTLIFRNMGTPWIVSPCLKIFNLDNLTVIFEDGFVLKEHPLYADKSDRRRYLATADFPATYPNGTLGTDYVMEERTKLFWADGSENLTVIAYGAEFIGSYPTKNPGTDPDTTTNGPDFSYEFGHWLQVRKGKNFSWSGGYVHNWAGDGFNVIEQDTDCFITDTKIYYNKRLGTQSHSILGKLVITDCDISYNGTSGDPTSPWGTLTKQGSTWEPNNEDESVNGSHNNCRFIGNGDSGVGLQTSKPTSDAPQDIIFNVDNCHFEGNGAQPDDNDAYAISLSATNTFSDPSSERGTKPLGGLAAFTNNAFWGERQGFLSTSQFEGNYDITFSETVVYKLNTDDDFGIPGDALVYWNPKATMPIGTKISNLDFGNITVVHELDDNFIYIENNFGRFPEVENSVTGNLTFVTDSLKPQWAFLHTGTTNNSTINETRYPLNNLPSNIVSIVGSGDAIKSTNTNGSFTFTRTGSTAFPTAVKYNVSTSGVNADMMDDFKLLRGSVVIPTGQSSITIPVIPLNIDRLGGERNITLNIEAAPDLYTFGTTQATIILADVPVVPVVPSVFAGKVMYQDNCIIKTYFN